MSSIVIIHNGEVGAHAACGPDSAPRYRRGSGKGGPAGHAQKGCQGPVGGLEGLPHGPYQVRAV